MSFDTIVAAAYVTHTPEGKPLTHIEMRTLVTLATYTRKDVHTCKVSVGALSRVTTISTKTLYGALKNLESWGFIARSTNVGAPNTYTLNIATMRACHGRSKHNRAQADTQGHPSHVEESSDPVEAQAQAPVKVETVEEAPIEVEIIQNAPKAVEAPQEPANASEGTITQPVQENPAEAPSGPVQGELIPAPTPKKARKARKCAAEIPGLEEDFIEFYTTYPLKKDRGTARGTYEKIRRRGVPAEEILEGAKRFAEATAAKLALDPSAKRYIKHPSTWLNAEAWLNAPEDEAPVQELTPTQAKTLRLARSLQAMQDAQSLPQNAGMAPTLTSSPQAPVQGARELTYNHTGQVVPMDAQPLAPTADNPWPNVQWTRTKSGILQIA